MLKITKQGKSLIVEGVNHSHYPFNDTLTYPMNSVAMTIDKGDIITFKSAANGDVLFSSMIDSILINDAPVTKEDIKTKFDMVSNVPQGGGGGGTGAVNSVNGYSGDVVLSASDVNAYSKREIDNKGYLTAVPDNYATDDEVSAAVADKVSTEALNQAIQGVEAKIPSTDNLATKNELNEGLELKADKTTIADMATKSWVGEQDYATNTLVESKLDKNTYNEDKATFALKSEIPSIEGLATQEWVGQQGYLNAIPDNYATDDEVSAAVADKVSTTALNQAIEGVEAKIPTNTSQLNNDSNFITSIPENYVTDEELTEKNYATVSQLPDISTKQDKLIGSQVEGQNIKTINGQTLLGEGNIEITAGGGGGKVDSVNGQVGNVVLTAADLDVYTKGEVDAELNAALASKANTSDIADMATMTWVNGENFLKEVPSEYITESELELKNYATKGEIPSLNGYATEEWVGKQGYLTSIPENYVTDEELNLKNYATVDQLPNIEGKLDTSVYDEDKKTFALKSEIPSIEGLATQEWVGQQGYLNAIPEEYAKKTDIDTAVADKVSTTALNQAIEGVEAKIPSTDNLATKAEISDMATMSWVNGKGYSKTIKLTQQEYDQLPSKDADTLYIISDAEAVDISSKLDKSVYDADKANFATKDEIPSLVGYATQEWVNGENFLKEVPSEYITETELSNKNYATVSQLPDISGKQDTLVNQVNIKSINGQTLLGEGNIDIQGGGGTVTVDAQLSTESENPVQNKIITNELNKKVESLEITQEEYNALEVKDPNVMYIITDGPEVALKSDLTNLATKDELNSKADASAIVDMATQAWVTEQINAAIAQVNEKITEINNKIV